MGLAVQNERLTRAVGALVILLLIAAVTLALTLEGCHWRSGIHVRVYFEHTPLFDGAEVQVAGTVIGEVENVGLVPSQLAQGNHPLAGTGGVVLELWVDARYAERAAINGEYFINAKGILGQPYLEIGPPADQEESQRAIRDGDHIRGIDPPRMDRVLQRSYENLMATSLFMDAVRPAGKDLVRELRALFVTLDALQPNAASFDDLSGSLDELFAQASAVQDKFASVDVGFDDMRQLADSARRTFDLVDRRIGEVRVKLATLGGEIDRIRLAVPDGLDDRVRRVIADADAHFAKLQNTMATVRELAAMLERGEGTIGALANDPEFSDDAKKLGKYIKRHPWVVVGVPEDDP